MALGALATKYSPTGVTHIQVALVGNTPKTWTHNFGITPLKTEVFLLGADVRGAGAGQVAVTTGVNTITLTPNTLTNTVDVLIQWTPNPTITTGVPATNFV
jgi:hypothetical protein